MKQIFLHFPDGEELNLNTTYHQGQYHIGEKVFFTGEKTTWIITDIQHQLRKPDEDEMTIVILEEEHPLYQFNVVNNVFCANKDVVDSVVETLRMAELFNRK